MSSPIELPEDVKLEIVEGPGVGTSYAITNKTITIGREQGCDMQLADETVSNKHCQIVFRGGHFTVIDLGSLNKTKVNGEVFVQKNLKNGDLIKLGKNVLKFSCAEEAAGTDAEAEAGGGEEEKK